MRRTRRNHAAGFKTKVALAALKGDKTLAELAQAFDVRANQIVECKQQMVDRAARYLVGDLPASNPPNRTSKCCTPRLASSHWSMIVEKGRSSRRDC
jgi:transposase